MAGQKSQIVGFKCTEEMIKEIDELIEELPLLRPGIFSSSRSDVIRCALKVGLEQLQKQAAKTRKAKSKAG